MGGARMVKEVVEPMLDEGQPEEKLQEPYCYGEWVEWSRMKNENPETGALATLI
jgi:hypothetical protein